MKEYRYGYAEIARASGRTVGSVRVDVTRKRIDPAEILSVSLYVVASRLMKIEEEEDERSGEKAV